MYVKANIPSVPRATWAVPRSRKSPVGSIFYDFFGSNTMKSDISISVSELGSLLDHSGPHKEAEEYIARVFNAERSYMVTNGTSTANKNRRYVLRACRQHRAD